MRPAGDTRWGSHYNSLARINAMFDAIINVMQYVADEATLQQQRAEAEFALESVLSFDFVFSLIMMKKVLAVSVDFSNALQRKDQDIVNALSVLHTTLSILREMRESGWNDLFEEVEQFCRAREILVPSMDDNYHRRGRRSSQSEQLTNDYHYRVQIFLTVIDEQIAELEHRFPTKTVKLLRLAAAFDPKDKFKSFCETDLIELAKLYKDDFDQFTIGCLEGQLKHYIRDVRESISSEKCKSLRQMSEWMVSTNKNETYPLVYRLMTLVLLLPVSTATAERAFSAMKIVKSRLRNRLSDEFLSDLLLLFIEKEMLRTVPITKKSIAERYVASTARRGQYNLN